MGESIEKQMLLRELVGEIRDRAEDRIKDELSGFGGIFKRPLYNSRMPICVLVKTEAERCELMFLNDGNVEFRESSSAEPDVTIVINTRSLQRLYRNPSAGEFRVLESQGKVRITADSEKGREAESYIRKFLSL